MPLPYDPSFIKIAGPALEALNARPQATPHDIPSVRLHLESMNEPSADAAPALPGIEETAFHIPSYDGYIVSSKLQHPLVSATGIPIFDVEYRLAPEDPYPKGLEDVYAALTWVHAHGTELKIDNARLAIMGESAGGGIAAAVAIMARDRGLSPSVKKQILYCPALDDRTSIPDPELEGRVGTWNYVHNGTAWGAYLGREKAGGEDVEPYAAPARLKNFSGLPSAYIDVGELDIFRGESKAFAKGLRGAGVDVELHVYEGLPHVFEFCGFGTEPVMRAFGNRVAAVKGLVYC